MSPELSPQAAVFTPLHQTQPETASVAAGYTSGYTAGWSAGSRAAAKEAETQRRRTAEETAARARQASVAAQEALQSLAHAADAARARLAPVLSDAEAQLTQAAVSLAEALLGSELRDDDASAQAALRRALTVREEDLVTIRLNPADLEHLDATLAELPAELRVPTGVELVADPTLARGDAVSELAEGYLDARLGTAVTRVRAALEVEQ